MSERPKHPKKELEEVLRTAERQGWRVTKRPNAYYKMYCTCANKDIRTVKLSPSNPNYKRNLLAELKRNTCWREDA